MALHTPFGNVACTTAVHICYGIQVNGLESNAREGYTFEIGRQLPDGFLILPDHS